MSGPFKQHLVPHPDGGHTLTVSVTPESKRAHIKADRSGLRVYVADVEGEPADAAAIKALARQMGRPRSAFTLISRNGPRERVYRVEA